MPRIKPVAFAPTSYFFATLGPSQREVLCDTPPEYCAFVLRAWWLSALVVGLLLVVYDGESEQGIWERFDWNDRAGWLQNLARSYGSRPFPTSRDVKFTRSASCERVERPGLWGCG